MALILIALLIAVSAFSNSVMDTIKDHYSTSVFKDISFFDPDRWKNKYKDGDPKKGAAFMGSTTVLVWLTDAWHLFKMIWIISMVSAVAFGIKYCHYNEMTTGRMCFTIFICCVIYGSVFETFYMGLLRKNNK